MTGNAGGGPRGEDAAALAERHEDLVWWATWIGLLVAAVGLIDGVVMAVKKEEVDCPNGKVSPEGTTDFTCSRSVLALMAAGPLVRRIPGRP